MKRNALITLISIGLSLLSMTAAQAAETPRDAAEMWALAQERATDLRFSTLFTAQNVRDLLATSEGIDRAILWCKKSAVTHVYLETFRDGYTAERETLLQAKRRFLDAGFLVSGCVTTTKIGRKSAKGWIFPCFTEQAGLVNLERIFKFTAELFDEIMVDDFFATGCECEECERARGGRPWSEFRCDMLVDASKRYVLEPARAVNPDVKVIIKYPQWYDGFHERGYEVVRQSAMYDKTWVGTETRDPDSQQWGRKAQYEAYFVLRWLGEIGGAKCGGGWFDPYGTSPPTYLEQARQTILGGAKEAVLFCYGSLLNANGPENVEALRAELPALFELNQLIRGKIPQGISAPKPPNSDSKQDRYIYDFIGMLGLPLAPTATVREDVPAAFLPEQTLKDPRLASKVRTMLEAGTPLLVTDSLAEKLPDDVTTDDPNVTVLDVPEDHWQLMDLPRERLREIRNAMLEPFGVRFDAPTRVALYLFDENLFVVENFNDAAADVTLKLKTEKRLSVALTIPAHSLELTGGTGTAEMRIPARSLVVLRCAR